jgi:opacity protein-like surface antigen
VQPIQNKQFPNEMLRLNMKQLIVATLFVFAFSAQAMAAVIPARTQTANSAPKPVATPVAARTGAYLGAQLGDSTIGALLGYQLTKMFAMEIRYDYVDPVYTDTTSLKKSRGDVSGLAMFPIKFSEMGPMALYVKVGYELYTEKYTVNNPGVPVPPATTTITTTHKTGVTGGAGVHVDLSDRTTARLGVNVSGSDRSVYLNAIYKF